jgi:hypothetical protein
LQYFAQFAEATNDMADVHTRSPFLIPNAKQAICKAEVAEFTATAYLDDTVLEILFSNLGTNVP